MLILLITNAVERTLCIYWIFRYQIYLLDNFFCAITFLLPNFYCDCLFLIDMCVCVEQEKGRKGEEKKEKGRQRESKR